MPPRCLKDSPEPWTTCRFNFKMISFLHEQVSPDLRVIVRGINSVDDALKAAESGASAVWISEKTHLRSAPSPISITYNISQTLKQLHPKCEVIMQGGVRRGVDALKAVAMGA